LDVTFEKKRTKAPPTVAQLVRDDYVSKVLEDKAEQNISESERQATIQCLLKVMKHQEQVIRNQLSNIEADNKRHQAELQDFQKEIVRNQEQRKLNEMKAEVIELKQIAGSYKITAEDPDAPVDDDNLMAKLEAEGEVDVMQLIADN
jgi:ABC-type Fe2+-enterobactin transport system substrate-binding protein